VIFFESSVVMCLVKIGSILALGTVTRIKNLRGQVFVTLDYYGKLHDYTIAEIEGMI